MRALLRSFNLSSSSRSDMDDQRSEANARKLIL